MDVLWQRQTIISTILKTLPADSWSVANGVFVRIESTFPFALYVLPDFQSLTRNVTQAEWGRFKTYTARVTALEVPLPRHRLEYRPDRFPAWISMETIQIFWMESQRGGFQPNVRSLGCNIN